MGNTNKILTFYYIDNSYIEHLIKDIDERVAFNKANLHQRPYVGFILEINGISYLVPLSSRIRKTNDITTLIPNTFTESQKQEEDFETKYPKFIATIKFNSMVPICDKLIKKIDLSKLTSNEEDIKYKDLLTKEFKFCNNNEESIIKKASKTYTMCEKNKPYKAELIKSCCDFPKLERAMINYMNTLN